MRTRRWRMRGAAMLPVALMLLVATAPAALAAISGLGDNETVRTAKPIDLRADYPPADPRVPGTDSPNRLTLTEPGKAPVEVASAPPASVVSGGQLQYTFDTRCWVPAAPRNPCVTPQIARNGTWTLVQTGATADTLSFRLLIPPDAPTGVTAVPASASQMRVSWRRGAEPDLRSFSVFEGERAVAEGLPANGENSACDATGGCGTVIAYQGGAGEHTYTVSAFRSDGTRDGSVQSARSAPASGTLLGGDPSTPPPASAAPGVVASPNPGASPGSSASPSASTAPRAAAKPRDGKRLTLDPGAGARRQAFSSGFNTFGPKLGIPKLPPLPESQEPSVALPDGSFEPTLGYDDQVLTEEDEEPGEVTAGGVRGAVSNLVDSEQLAKSTAGALVLLLAGAHLRRWLGATSPE